VHDGGDVKTELDVPPPFDGAIPLLLWDGLLPLGERGAPPADLPLESLEEAFRYLHPEASQDIEVRSELLDPPPLHGEITEPVEVQLSRFEKLRAEVIDALGGPEQP
jgi:hypothetical protein